MSDRLDPQFRDKLGNYEVPYNPADWASLQARLDAPTRRRRTLLWLGMPAAAVLLGVSAFFMWPNQPGERAIQATGQLPLESSEGSAANEADAGDARTDDTTARSVLDRNEAQASAKNQSAKAVQAERKQQTKSRRNDPGEAGLKANRSSEASSRANGQTNIGANSVRAEGTRPDALTRETQQSSVAESSVQEIAPQLALERQKFFPQPLDPMAAETDPTAPSDREWEKDPTLDRGRRLVDVALMGSVGLNAEYTAAGDGFRPGQDAGVGAELWFRSGVFLSAGLFYGQYHFHQNKVACGNPFSYGIKEPVHCPDALLGTQGRWEIPLQVGYGWNLARARGRFRVAAGITAQRVRQEDYNVEFHNAQPGVLLFYEPVTIAVTQSGAENLSFDAYGLVESTNEYTVQTVGPSERVLNTKINGAAELALGYEQFLAPSFSLGVEPRIGVPFNKLPVSDGRAYYGGVSARLRWYPGLGGR